MNNSSEKARQFLEEEQAFRLGGLLTESFHPRTRNLSRIARNDIKAAIALLQSVDNDIPPAAARVFQSDSFSELSRQFRDTLRAGKRIFFTGCGATGRLGILLEAMWRRFWDELARRDSTMADLSSFLGNRVYSVMAGGDFALIKSVEGFEDFPAFGRHQLLEMGVGPGDMVVAITEGGETPFVIGTAWQGLQSGAEVFFLYNNPTNMLRQQVERSREILDERNIHHLDLTTGPMAISGSTRMQAITMELLIVGAALEQAMMLLLKDYLTATQFSRLGFSVPHPGQYHSTFSTLLEQLSDSGITDALAQAATFEEEIYRKQGLVTYLSDRYLLDILTDTTERSPTFMVPPFRKKDDTTSPPPWAFVKNPFYTSPTTWSKTLQRQPRGLDWRSRVYRKLQAPPALLKHPPKLDNDEILQFIIGNEPDPSRYTAPEAAVIIVAVNNEYELLVEIGHSDYVPHFKRSAVMQIGSTGSLQPAGDYFRFPLQLADSPLQLWHHLAVKLIFNTISTITMVRLGRVIGNAMVWLSPSNKKLIDRGCRLIAEITGIGYEKACYTLFEALEEVQSIRQQGREIPSPVALALEKLQTGPDQGHKI